MELFEYIKSQLPQMPNVAIMKDLGASDELVEYVKETTWNTNLGMLETFGNEEGSDETYTLTWDDKAPDTTNVKVGDMVTAPYYKSPYPDAPYCNWYCGTLSFSSDGTEEQRTFEFTQEIAGQADENIVEFRTQCYD